MARLVHSKEDMTDRTAKKHIHHIDHRHPTITRPFFGPVAARQNPAAHGGCCEIARCRCGATRRTNVNGRHVERGPWILPTE